MERFPPRSADSYLKCLPILRRAVRNATGELVVRGTERYGSEQITDETAHIEDIEKMLRQNK